MTDELTPMLLLYGISLSGEISKGYIWGESEFIQDVQALPGVEKETVIGCPWPIYLNVIKHSANQQESGGHFTQQNGLYSANIATSCSPALLSEAKI